MTNEIIYDEYKENGNIITFTESKKLCKVLRNHMRSEALTHALQNPTCTRKAEYEVHLDNNFKESHKSPREDIELSENENEISPKEIDSGNVSPESLQLSSFRDDSRLSNITPTIAYTPETYLLEEEECVEDNLE